MSRFDPCSCKRIPRQAVKQSKRKVNYFEINQSHSQLSFSQCMDFPVQPVISLMSGRGVGMGLGWGFGRWRLKAKRKRKREIYF